MARKLQFSQSVLRGIRRPSQPVTGPVARLRAKQERSEDPAASSVPGRMRTSIASRMGTMLALPLIRVCLVTAGGGALVGLAAWAFGSGSFGLGFFLGSFLALFGLYSLKALTSKVLDAGAGRGLWLFHSMNAVRWILLAVVYFMLLRISVACLLGAVASYVWFLAVLAWFGIRSARPGGAAPAAGPSGPDEPSK